VRNADGMLTGCAGHHSRWGAATSARNALRVVVVDSVAGVAADTGGGTTPADPTALCVGSALSGSSSHCRQGDEGEGVTSHCESEKVGECKNRMLEEGVK